MKTDFKEDYPEKTEDDKNFKMKLLKTYGSQKTQRIAIDAFFGIGDLVRGSIIAPGDVRMKEHIDKLKKGLKIGSRSFTAWRIKNLHHASQTGANTPTGGYRDVKVLGMFQWASGAMIVEIQILDEDFSEIKHYMHKAYSLVRGDFEKLG